MSAPCIVTYTGEAPGADSELYVLFDSTVAFLGARMAQGAGIKRIIIGVNHSDAGDFVLSKSADRGATWQIVTTVAAASTSDDEEDPFDALIENYDDFKVEWENGNVAQDPWMVSIALSDERGPA
jgi:hypothetical protein